MKTFILLLAATLLLFQAGNGWHDHRGGKESHDRRQCVEFAHRCWCRLPHPVVPGQKFPKGSMTPVYYGIQRVELPLDDNGEILGYISQVEQTYTYFQSAYSHINEYQLCIGESTTSQRPELQVAKGEGKQIMTVEQAMIFALQRCKTAEEALELITFPHGKVRFPPVLQSRIGMPDYCRSRRNMGTRTI